MTTIRLLLAYAAIENLRISQFDIKTAFLYGDLEEEVFMNQPKGFELEPGKICRLRKSLYGLKQAPRQWNNKLTDFLLSLKLQVSEFDRCVFFRKQPFTIIAIYVDDGMIFARDQQVIDELMKQLQSRFEVHSMESSTFLGFQIERKRDHNIFIHQSSYVDKIINKFGMSSSNSEESPITTYSGSKDDTPLQSDIPYRECIGSLLYAAVCIRVDIAFAVGKASRHVSDPRVMHWHACKRILRYLVGNRETGLNYSLNKNEGLIAYCDADFAGDDETRRSTTGSMIMLAGAPIHWRSSRQGHVTTSSTEAEIVSLCSTIKDVMWIRKLATELDIIDQAQSTKVYCDNQSAILVLNQDKVTQRTKH